MQHNLFSLQTISEYDTHMQMVHYSGFSKWAWCSITSFINHAIQINVGQKDKEIQWRVVDLAEFLYTALLYQAMTNRNINAAILL